jgi:hypothetical protein
MITLTATLIGNIYPGIVGTPTAYNVDDIINKVDSASGSGTGPNDNPLTGIPIVGDIVTISNSFLASLGLIGAIIKNIVNAYGFLCWLQLPAAYAAVGAAVIYLFHVLTLIELKWGKVVG